MGVPVLRHKINSPQDIGRLAAKSNYRLVEAFSGPGGMSLGLKEAGFTPIYAFDSDAPSVQTHNANLGNLCNVQDVRKLSGRTLLKKLDLKRGDLDLLAGGPPCQGFSKQKRGAHLGDDRNDLVLEHIRLIDELRPRSFIFENVAIFGQKRGREYVEEFQRRLRKYTFYPHFYNSAEYGLAQTRERFIIVGIRNDLPQNFKIPPATTSRPKTIREAIGDLPEPPADYSPHPTYFNHQLARISALNAKRFSFVPQGGGWQDIPHLFRLECHKRVDTTRGGWPDVYGRLRWDGQCPTITGGFDNFSRGRFGHPKHNRAITAREAARIQGFPDSFRFFGNRGDVRSQIGNAVPPPLAAAVGCEILRCLLIADGRLAEDSGYFREPGQMKLAI